MNEAQLDFRKKGIGGSEVASILGLDEYGSPYKVWLAKTGRQDSHVDNKYTTAGRFLEDAVSVFFQHETKYRIIKASAKPTAYVHPMYEFAHGMPDRRYIGTGKIGQGILECKTTQRTLDDIQQAWFCQLQWYLGVVGSLYGGVAWLERGLEFKYREYEYDSDFFDYMLGKVSDFWLNNVLKDIPPEPLNVEDVQLMFKRHTEGQIIQATPEILYAHGQLAELKEAIKAAEEEKTKLEDQVKMVMRDAEAVMNGAEYLFTWKASKDTKSFDKDRFKAENPNLWENYLVDVAGSRRFLLK
jgi:predicted phage-related endonuclease